MAAGTIISVLANIPWGQVVENAPKVADGAARLWNAVTRKKADPSAAASVEPIADAAQSDPHALSQRVVAMEAHILRLEEQMGASAELIKALAEQNTQLVRQLELHSIRLRRLVNATAIGSLVLLGVVVYLLLQR